LPLRALFEAPTLAGLAGRIEDARSARTGTPPTTLAPVPRSSHLALSFAQERLWFLDQLSPGAVSYNMPAAIRLVGRLDLRALERTFSEIVRRHEALRTTFPARDGRPMQLIHPARRVPLPLVDLSALPGAIRETWAVRIGELEARRPFDLARGPLMRTRLLRLTPERHVLLVTMHHVVFDGWSTDIFIREVETLYAAFAAGRSSPLPDPPIQYADFAAWQRQRVGGEVLARQLEYWRRKLQSLTRLALPTDRQRTVTPTYRGLTETLALDRDLAAALNRLSRQHNSTLFMTLLAAFKVLLSRYSGQTDIVVGAPVSGRDRAEVEDLIGFFVNTLVLRSDLSGDPTFSGLLARVRNDVLEAFEHQDVPFEKLVEELQPERDLSGTPLFEVFFNMVSYPEARFRLPGLEATLTTPANPDTKFDLTLYVTEQDGTLVLQLSYNARLFEKATVRCMLEHLRALLLGIVQDPVRALSSLPFVDERERTAQVRRGNRVRPSAAFTPFERGDVEQSIPARFARQVAAGPDRPAVVTASTRWTYAQLDSTSNRVARAILARRGSPGDRVGLLFEHDAPLLAGLLGALKAGRTYVPLDPRYPVARNTLLLRDAHVAAIVSDDANLDLARSLAGARVAVVPAGDASAGSDEVQVKTTPGDLAYILYTSGSTGVPKGVMQSHRNVLHHIRNYTNALHLGPRDRLSLLSSYTFDAAVMDIFGALLNGAALCLRSLRDEGLPHLARWLRDEQITVYHSTPTVYRYLLGTLTGSEAFPRLRIIVLGGEAVYKRDVDLYKKHFGPGCVLVNGLGPTESTLALQYFLDRDTEVARHAVPVGFPVEDAEVLLLDGSGHPTDVYGEIAVRSPSVALGYWQKPELTRRNFLEAGPADARRLYRTGDMGRRLPDGSIEFVGRRDQQVKIRGHRVEVGEVESALLALGSIKEAVVTARSESGETCLVAYLVPDGPPAPAARALRRALLERLPDYMVPSSFVPLDGLPVTPNGKIDYAALPPPETGAWETGGVFRPPRTALEGELARIWADVLVAPRIGLDDNFFELGGHSLMATQLVSRVRNAFAVDLPLRSLFEHPTVAALAEVIEQARRENQSLEEVPLRPCDRTADLPLSFAQERLWFLDHLTAGSALFNLVTALRLSGPVDLRVLKRCFDEVLRRHEALRTVFGEKGQRRVQVIAPFEPLRIPVVDLRGLPMDQSPGVAQALAESEGRRPFDLARGPLFRVSVLQVGPKESVVLLSLHHIVADGWSLGVLVREVAALYKAYGSGGPSPLGELPIQYADYAQWQREWLGGGVLDRQLAYWRERLRGLPILDVPADRPRPPVQSHRGAAEPLRLPRELSSALLRMTRNEGVTLFEVLLAAYQLLLSRYAGRTDIAVGAGIANRTRPEVEGLIGFFVNLLVMRTDLSGNPRVRDLLRRVREVTLGAYAHQDIPFERLVEELQPGRDLSREPLVQVALVLQNMPMPPLELPGGVSIGVLDLPRRNAKYDLTLYAWEGEDGLSGFFEYSTDLFDAATVARMAGHFRLLLEGMVGGVERRLSELGVLTGEERERVVGGWNATGAEYGWKGSIQEAFERQARERPEAQAVLGWGAGDAPRGLTYGELNRRANLLARRLLALGVGPEERVVVCLERSPEMVLGMLGTLKAGGAYVPVDPQY
ncbi:MAG TPA: amino acid adenylation domain-containing protein, partial [Candidatus Cryosericum sp.]|nr:amino acid adenylation domain-containing protein [Candidatus Cryosericum sp.]